MAKKKNGAVIPSVVLSAIDSTAAEVICLSFSVFGSRRTMKGNHFLASAKSFFFKAFAIGLVYWLMPLTEKVALNKTAPTIMYGIGPKNCLIQKSSKNTGTETRSITLKANMTPLAFSVLGF